MYISLISFAPLQKGSLVCCMVVTVIVISGVSTVPFVLFMRLGVSLNTFDITFDFLLGVKI
jgi:hypothetical protein